MMNTAAGIAKLMARPAGIVLLAAAFAGCEGGGIPTMGVSGRAPVVPPVNGYLGGEAILFLHTEASDSSIAETLTEMMGSPVPVVSSLARVPPEATARVYVFSNGVEPEGARGPLGFQPDVFDCAIGAACYSPLRGVSLVAWTDPERARVLTSAGEVRTAIDAGELTVDSPGVVVNMPLLTWPGGKR